jgi:hypothetical protein
MAACVCNGMNPDCDRCGGSGFTGESSSTSSLSAFSLELRAIVDRHSSRRKPKKIVRGSRISATRQNPRLLQWLIVNRLHRKRYYRMAAERAAFTGPTREPHNCVKPSRVEC